MIPGSGSSPGEGIGYPVQYSWASLVAQMVKNPPAVWETWVRSLGWEDPLVQGMATHGQRSLVGYSAWGRKESDTTERLNTAHTSVIDNLCPPTFTKYEKQLTCLLMTWMKA